MTSISDARIKKWSIMIEGTISNMGSRRLVQLKTGGTAEVCDMILMDDEGDKIKLTLWDNNINKVRDGSRVRIENGYIKEFRNKTFLAVSKFNGKLLIINNNTSQQKSKPRSFAELADTPEDEQKWKERISKNPKLNISNNKPTAPAPTTKPQPLSDNTPEDCKEVNNNCWPRVHQVLSTAFAKFDERVSDSRLKNYKIQEDDGDPIYQRGRFAYVFKAYHDQHFHALRFFIVKKELILQRYLALESFHKNKGKNLEFLINFEYIKNAIKVKSCDKNLRFPIIKMDWIEGKTLEQIIKENSTNGEICDIKEKFREMITVMEKLEFAHCDLSWKNIMIEGSSKKLKLVDYDGVYIPDFKNQRSPEAGDPAFQHPNRVKFEYNHKIDRFSALAIYLAFSAISEDPNIISNIISKDEDVDIFIFNENDYKHPEKSDIFKKISQQSKFNQCLLKYLKRYCKEDFPNIEELNKIIEKCHNEDNFHHDKEQVVAFDFSNIERKKGKNDDIDLG